MNRKDLIEAVVVHIVMPVIVIIVVLTIAIIFRL